MTINYFFNFKSPKGGRYGIFKNADDVRVNYVRGDVDSNRNLNLPRRRAAMAANGNAVLGLRCGGSLLLREIRVREREQNQKRALWQLGVVSVL